MDGLITIAVTTLTVISRLTNAPLPRTTHSINKSLSITHLKLDWINFGTVKILYMILEHSCREPEVVVKCCVRNLSNLLYCKVISRCGHRGFGLRS